jgi:hypothetical protein
MWEAITTMFNDLPIVYRMIAIPVLIIFAVWVFSHLRRDKQGKFFWYSGIYEQRKHDKKIDKVIDTVEHMSLDMLRLQLFNDSLPVEEQLMAGARYVESGGNGPSEKRFEKLKAENAEVWEIVQNIRGKK